jgi:hypothetical protein
MTVTLLMSEVVTTSLGRGDPIEFPPDNDPDGSGDAIAFVSESVEACGGNVTSSYNSSARGGKGIDGLTGWIQSADIIAIFGTIGSAAATLKLITDALIAWMNNRASRSIRIKINDREVEIKGKNDVAIALDIVNRLNDKDANNSFVTRQYYKD